MSTEEAMVKLRSLAASSARAGTIHCVGMDDYVGIVVMDAEATRDGSIVLLDHETATRIAEHIAGVARLVRNSRTTPEGTSQLPIAARPLGSGKEEMTP